jgi:4-alpha-glucanotransferase
MTSRFTICPVSSAPAIQEATAHAHAAGLVILKGDLAIGVYRHGADAWQQPELFHADHAGGRAARCRSPPRARIGAFPTYNWPRMAADGFAWWKQRFAQMSCYFDAFRIDHILGFFRIWSNPAHAVEGILGYFVPAIPVDAGRIRRRAASAFDRDRLHPAVHHRRRAAGNFRRRIRNRAAGIFDCGRRGVMALKPEFATQRQVEKHFRRAGAGRAQYEIKTGLFDLISNVILLEAEGSRGKSFHFRFAWSTRHRSSPARLRHSGRNCASCTWIISSGDRMISGCGRRHAEAAGAQARHQHADMRRGPGAGARLRAGRDEGSGLVEPGNPAHAQAPGAEFSRPADAPYLSVVTPSTHDMSTIRGWWEEDRGVDAEIFQSELGRPGEAPRQAGRKWSRPSCGSIWPRRPCGAFFNCRICWAWTENCAAPTRAAERINVPANPAHYWRYRIHLTLEELQRTETFNANLRDLIRQNGR